MTIKHIQMTPLAAVSLNCSVTLKRGVFPPKRKGWFVCFIDSPARTMCLLHAYFVCVIWKKLVLKCDSFYRLLHLYFAEFDLFAKFWCLNFILKNWIVFVKLKACIKYPFLIDVSSWRKLQEKIWILWFGVLLKNINCFQLGTWFDGLQSKLFEASTWKPCLRKYTS